MKPTSNIGLFLLILGLAAQGCTSGSLSGGTKGKAKEEEPAEDEELEDTESESPQEVAGAFLVGCTEADDEKAPDGSVMMGCFVRDKESAEKVDVEDFKVTAHFKDGASATPPMKKMGKDSRWSGIFEMENARHDQLTAMDVSFKAQGKSYFQNDVGDGTTVVPSVVAYVFTTSPLFTVVPSGDHESFSGIAGANKICNAVAADGGVSVPGTWQAYLSTNGGFPIDIDQNTVRVVRHAQGVGKELIGAHFQTDAGTLFQYDERGELFPEGKAPAWTGIGKKDGKSYDCGDWKSEGEAYHGDPYTDHWASDGVTNCDEARHLYCVLLHPESE